MFARMMAAAGMLLAVPVQAQAPRTLEADLVCLLVSTHLADKGRPTKLRQYGQQMKMFYMGRVDAGGLDKAALAVKLDEQARRLTVAPPMSDIDVCLSFVMEQTKVFDAAGKQVKPVKPE